MKTTICEIGNPLENIGLVSIVVPVYNASKFLHRALDSILWQTYPHWEAILVNDGSTDNSLEILQQYAQQDARFKVIDKPNGGHSSARNAGMDVINGKYTAFLDNDDMLYPQFLEILLKTLLQSKADMVWCKSEACTEDDGLTFCKTYDKFEFFEQPNPLDWYFLNKRPRISLPPWGRIYHTDKLKDLRFVTEFKRMCEDFNFSLQYFERCLNIVCVRQYLIAWRQNSSSLTHKNYAFDNVNDHILVATLAQSNFQDYKYKKAMNKKFAEILFEYSFVQPYLLKLDNYMDFWKKYSIECHKLVDDKVYFPQCLPLWKRGLASLALHQKWGALRCGLNLYLKFRK